MRVLVRGAGDLASGVAVRLHRAGFSVLMTEIGRPSAIRRTVSFSTAVYEGGMRVEGIQALHARSREEAESFLANGEIPVLVDPEGKCKEWYQPDVVVDAILAKKNLGTKMGDAPIVIALGPGFVVGMDCHAAVETMRGHDLGRVYYGYGESPLPNTGVPGEIGGHSAERVMHSPCAGLFFPLRRIGDQVQAGETVATVAGKAVITGIGGILRGILPEGYPAHSGMKCADVDPRCKRENCYSVSDKARSLGGAVLEAILALGWKEK